MMKVLKFGGTSLGKAENIKRVIDIVKKELQKSGEISIVVSAFSGVTNDLIRLGNLAKTRNPKYKELFENLKNRHVDVLETLIDQEKVDNVRKNVNSLFKELYDVVNGVYLLKELTPKSLDLIMSFGERLSAHIISEYAKCCGIDAEFVDARDLVITDENFGSARVIFEKTFENIKNFYKENKRTKIITGFIASTEEGETITLGRGGSDFTASIFATALGAEEVQIWTDVNGVMTADPNKVPDAFPIDFLTYEEAMELSHFGAKVIYPPAIQPAMMENIPIRILNTFNPSFEGTILQKTAKPSAQPIKGISSIENIALLRIQGSGMVGVPGTASRIFGALARKEINVILITQASSEHSICIAVEPNSVKAAKKVIESEFALEIKTHMVDEVVVEEELSIVAIVGENMRRTVGISGRLFNSLGENGINVVAIAQGSSELNISIVIAKNDEIKALNVIHEAFFLSKVKTVNLFIVGTGLIGSTLLKRIRNYHKFFIDEQGIDLKVIGLANIDKMLFDIKGINLASWQELLEKSTQQTDIAKYCEEVKKLNLPYSIFIDCTASEKVVKYYPEIIKSNISIVTPNKLANISRFNDYKKIRELCKKHNTHFLYETNVGAGLPIISTLCNLLNSGDQIIKIEAILSGTLTYIFTNINKNNPLSKVVKDAMKKGYTEPDPRVDLSGMDMAKKLLILIREMGVEMELEDIHLEKFLPEKLFRIETVESFWEELEKYDSEFETRRSSVWKNGRALRYIARYENNEAKISLEEIDKNHPFYSLKGSDNIVAFTTERYKETPLIIKGAGAGAEVTASGVLADIIKISNYLK